MLKKFRALLMFSLALSLTSYGQVAASPAREEAKIKAAIAKLGTGFDARVELKLRDKTKLKGYVSQADEDYFTVVEDATGTPRQVSYAQVKKIEGPNFLNANVNKIAYGLLTAVIVGTFIGYKNYPVRK